MVWLQPLDTLAKKRGGDDARAVGGKAARLAWLHRNNFAVPQAWVLSPQALQVALQGLPALCDPRALLRAAGGHDAEARAAEAREHILRAALPAGLSEELAQLWDDVSAHAPWGLAVRSSASCEDGTLVSLAGLAETRLGIRGAGALADAIRAVWASVASGRALTYLAAHGVKEVAMAVVLQRMVEAEAAGVMYTRSPELSGSKPERIVNAGFGLGAPVVDGRSTPDMLRIDQRGRLVEAVIAHKALTAVVDATGVVESPSPDPDAPALNQVRIAALKEIAERLEQLDDTVWDVEFACDRENTWVVQARPVTGRIFPEGGTAETLWSNVNVGEALPGVATPLTWSVAGAFSEAGFRSAFAALGCTVPKNTPLVANVYGRFYLNLSQFMRVAAQVPWLDPRKLVELAGGAGGEELASQVADVSHARFYARLPITATRLLREQIRLDAHVARYEAQAIRAQTLHAARDLTTLSDEELATKIKDVQALLERTGTVMLTCASSSLGTHLLLRALLSRGAPSSAERLAQSLTSGIRDLESARPAIGIMRIAALARRESEAMAAIVGGTRSSLDGLPEGPTKRAISSFLALYGDRAVREADLSTPRWKEDPRQVLTMVKVALRGDGREVEPALARARAQADTEMQRIVPQLSLIEQTVLRHLVARAQKAARLRERMRAWVTRVLGMLREVMLEADRRLLRLIPELLTAAEIPAVFFLRVEEVEATLKSARTDLAPLVRARRAEYARDVARPDPPPTFLGAPPGVVLPPAGGDLLRGIPASTGIVEGPARVLSGEAQMGLLLPGEVLVVHTTDVGWTPLFLIAAGIVTELGGPLSHAAVVAREFGVPTVVNVPGATLTIRTGDRLRVDGESGTVERLRPVSDSAVEPFVGMDART